MSAALLGQALRVLAGPPPVFSLGRHTRLLLAAYLRQIFVVAAILLAIALTIDLWPQIDLVDAGRGGMAATWAVLRFSVLRVPDLMAPLLPLATFLGVVATEVAHTRSGERLLVWNSGRSPLHCLTPVLLAGAIMGVLEFSLDALLGPAAMTVQMHERLGRDGQRLDRTRVDVSHWIAIPEGLLDTQIEYGPPAVLRDLRLFQLDGRGRLTEIDEAARAEQLPGGNRWLLRDGRFWTPSSASDQAGPGGSERLTPFSGRIVSLRVDPLWLSFFGVEPQYLRFPILERLARSQLVPSRGLYRTRLQILYGELVMPGAMGLLASSVSMVVLAYRTPPRAVIGIMLAGYLAHAATKACLLMGENDYLPAMIAGWFVPLGLIAASAVTFRVILRQRRGVRPEGASEAAAFVSLE